MYKTIIISLMLLVTMQVKAQKTASIKGSMKAYKYDFVLKGETALEKLKGTKTKVERNEEGEFDFNVKISKARTFSLGYASIYLEPGDKIEIVETFGNGRPQYSFEGDKAEINNFIRKHFLHTKSGSWCQAGMNVRKYKLEEFIEFCKTEKAKYLIDLKALKAPKEFKKEFAQKLEIHYYNSLTLYPQYYAIFNKGADVTPFYEVIKKNIPRKIKVEGVDSEIDRTILSSNTLKHIEVEIETTKEVRTYQKVAALLSELQSQGISGSLLKTKEETTASLANKTYQEIINKAFAKYDKVLPGAIVSNLKLKTPKGEEIQLSQYKGKMLVIDVWATWCGPCMKEKPHFAELAKKYSGNKQIAFLAVSVDDNKAWEKYCTKKHHETENVQFANIERAKMDEAFLTKFVPRFMVIGKNQKIIDAFAPLPSTGKLDELIKKGL